MELDAVDVVGMTVFEYIYLFFYFFYFQHYGLPLSEGF